MKKKEQYIKVKNLSVSKILFDFINNELLKSLNIKKNKFWNDFSKVITELTPKNKRLLETREKLQKQIAKKLRKDEEFYLYCSNNAKENYKEYYHENKFNTTRKK